MGRLEEALEKAVQMREQAGSGVSGGAEPLPGRDLRPGGPRFEVRAPLVSVEEIDPRIAIIASPASAAAEQYRKLRTRVLGAARERSGKTVLVASSGIGEGKTTTALNLAIAIAQELDYTVLLVDADLRRPSVHTMLGIRPERGLSDYLQGNAALEDILVHTGLGKLVVLPAGKSPENPAELLASNRMAELIRELKERYADRYIVFDTAPLLAAADTVSLARHMDGIVMVIQAERTAPAEAQKALALLGAVPVLGAVLNNVPEHLLSSGHPYYTYSYEMIPGERQPSEHRKD